MSRTAMVIALAVLSACGSDADVHDSMDDQPTSMTTGTTTGPPETTPPDEEAMVCETGTLCDDQCVDLQASRSNCGECGVSCDSSEACIAGRCTAGTEPECRPGECGAGHVCRDGACQPGCSSDAECPRGTCDLETNTCRCTPGRPGVLSAYELLGTPRAMTMADFDADGSVDIVTSGFEEDQVEILWGNGDGTFEEARSLGVGDYPSDVVTLDVGGDGLPDLLLADGSNDMGQIRLVENVGQRGFGSGRTIESPFTIRALAVGDLNGDGLDDFVGLDSVEHAVVLFVQRSDRTFEVSSRIVSGKPRTIVVTNLDQDRFADLVVGEDEGDGPARVSIHWGSTDGFVDGPEFDVDGLPALAVGRLNGDRVRDVVASDTSGVSVFYGTGNRQFADPQQVSELSNARSVSLGDVNLDGVDEIVLSGRDDDALILLERAGGQTVEMQRLLTGVRPSDAALKDLDGDGFPDIISVDESSRTISILPADGAGGFVSATSIRTESGANIWHTALADVDGDGRDDIAAVRWDSAFSIFGSTRDFAEESHELPFSVRALEFGDLTGDGVLDVVLVGGFDDSAAMLMRGGPDGTFAAPEALDIPVDYSGFSQLALDDLDGDGNLDVVTGGDALSGRDIFVGFGDGAGGIRESVRIDADARGTHGFVTGDFDGDGLVEFACVYGVDQIAIYAFDGASAFDEQLVAFDEYDFVEALAVVDSDGDGVDELAVSLANWHTGHYVAIVDAVEAPVIMTRSSVKTAPEEFAVADSDGDGHDDLFGNWDGKVYRFAGTGSLGFDPPEVFVVAAQRLIFGNLDGDDLLDGVFHNPYAASPWLGIAQGNSCR